MSLVVTLLPPPCPGRMAKQIIAFAVLCTLFTVALGARTGDLLKDGCNEASWLREFRYLL